MKLRCHISLLIFILFFTSFSYSQSNKLIISEFLAINESVLADEDGDFPDWIEIYNPGTDTINLKGWFLTDNPLNIPKWPFPGILIFPNEYMLVFASEKNRVLPSGNLHTNFKLSGSGEFLALIEPDGVTVSSSFGTTYPVQQENVSYGLFDGHYIYMKNPTPGAENIIGGFVTETVFSTNRGFYSSPFDVKLSNINSNCNIYYTSDGSRPAPTNGTKYTSPIAIDKTTVLSAVSIDSVTLDRSDVITQTYLFVDNIMVQPSNPDEYTPVWGDGYPADYEMDPEICTAENREKIEVALKSLPTVSLVTDYNHLFYDSDEPETGGLYMNTTKITEEWERPVSMEYFDSTQSMDFQVNCGLRIHGGNGRKPGNSPKHSFRVSFRSDYGPSKLNYNMFEEKSAANEFNALVLRAGYNYSWVKNSPVQCEGADYIRDPFAKKTQLALDRPAAHDRFVHLYLNGLYWGVYDISEKITDDFAETYLGGNEEDYDVVKDHFGVTDGNRQAWDSLMAIDTESYVSLADYQKVQGKNEDGSVNASYQNLLDVRNLADYMLINFYIGNKDWDGNNWLAARNRVSNEHGFKFFCWDSENSMNELNENIVNINNSGNPSELFRQLLKNKEFKLFFADRVHKHFFNGGALTAAETETRYMNIANSIDKAMLAESARWGDYRRDVDSIPGYDLYTRNEHWLERVIYMQTEYLPQRSDIVLNQLIEAELYPEIEAPVFSPFGGDFELPVDLSMSSGSNTIYYTTDESDPREIGGDVAINRANQYTGTLKIFKDVIIKARAKNGDVWSALTRAKFKVKAISVDTIISEAICQGEEYAGFKITGTHYIAKKSSLGNDSIIEIHLTVYPLPNIIIGNDTTIFLNKELVLESKSDFASYLWSTNETSKSIKVIGSSLGEVKYWLQVDDNNGCINTDTISLTIIEPVSAISENYADVIKVFPNPATDIIYVEFPNPNSSEVFIELSTITGVNIYNNKFKSDHITEQINLEFLSEGIYILKIWNRDFDKVIKIMKK